MVGPLLDLRWKNVGKNGLLPLQILSLFVSAVGYRIKLNSPFVSGPSFKANIRLQDIMPLMQEEPSFTAAPEEHTFTGLVRNGTACAVYQYY